jgi:hypothetical protein
MISYTSLLARSTIGIETPGIKATISPTWVSLLLTPNLEYKPEHQHKSGNSHYQELSHCQN